MWARISIFIVAALMLAAAGGAWFGHMLVQQAPKSPVPAASGSTPIAIGLNGGQIPEPPQPRLDGSLGVPERAPAIPVPDAPLVSILDDENVPIPVSSASSGSGSKEDDLEALLLRESNFLSNSGVANPAPPPASAGMSQPAPQPAPRRDGELPPELAFAVALPADAPAPGSANSTPAWLGNLRASLSRCSTQRYFSQSECEQRLRLQHCEPNRGWGQVPECPAYLRNTRF
jgi:hypothetical protein